MGEGKDIFIAAAKGIHDADAFGKTSTELHVPVELNDPVGNCLHLSSLQMNNIS
jgi:hypothetical protein